MVRQSHGLPGTAPDNMRSDQMTIVYYGQIRMTRAFAYPCVSGRKWRGQLSTSDWSEGCVSGDFYSVEVGLDGEGGETDWLPCRRRAAQTSA
jgi:hypothetical protein